MNTRDTHITSALYLKEGRNLVKLNYRWFHCRSILFSAQNACNDAHAK